MKIKLLCSILFLFAFWGVSFAAEIRLPSEAELTATGAPDKKTWRQCGTMPLTYATAKKKFDLSLRKQGWTKLKTVDYDRIQWKTLEIWRKGKERILVQYWREDVARTGFAWGTLETENKA